MGLARFESSQSGGVPRLQAEIAVLGSSAGP